MIPCETPLWIVRTSRQEARGKRQEARGKRQEARSEVGHHLQTRGRPKSASSKEAVKSRLDADVLAAWRAIFGCESTSQPDRSRARPRC
ncbi:BrnA antitoxin family protein [Limnohabitans sp. DCL3]|uniref:BrnA antitoxin family protein n=1 Tax=Limnohabitans sp. DCL3 TaxID=3374103 RepID=UPI003A89AD8C